MIGAITRTLGVVGLLDGELARERRAAAVKVRARGVSGGELMLALADGVVHEQRGVQRAQDCRKALAVHCRGSQRVSVKRRQACGLGILAADIAQKDAHDLRSRAALNH